MMNEFSHSVLKVITEHFPELTDTENKETPFLELVIPATENAAIGGMVIQITEDDGIWIRNFHPYSSYEIEDAEELVAVMKNIFDDQLFWAIGYNGEAWIETELFKDVDAIGMVNGAIYYIFSWSGQQDKTIFEN